MELFAIHRLDIHQRRFFPPLALFRSKLVGVHRRKSIISFYRDKAEPEETYDRTGTRPFVPSNPLVPGRASAFLSLSRFSPRLRERGWLSKRVVCMREDCIRNSNRVFVFDVARIKGWVGKGFKINERG